MFSRSDALYKTTMLLGRVAVALALPILVAHPAVAGPSSKRRAPVPALSSYALAVPEFRPARSVPRIYMNENFGTDPDPNIRASLRREDWWRKG